MDGGEVSREQNILKDMASAHAVLSAVIAVETIYALAGSSAIYRNSRLDRCFRDLTTLKQHFAIGHSRFVAAGEMLING